MLEFQMQGSVCYVLMWDSLEVSAAASHAEEPAKQDCSSGRPFNSTGCAAEETMINEAGKRKSGEQQPGR